jgi:hypothetical protein
MTHRMTSRLTDTIASRTTSRREFLATTSLAAAGTVLATHGLSAQRLPAAALSSSQSAHDILREPMAPLALQQLATSSVDAAIAAGAAYADLRIAERHVLAVDYRPSVRMYSTLTYGVRVLVDGSWAFVHGCVPDTDAVTSAARDAVAMAKGYAPLVVTRAELAQTPVVKGEWTTPIQDDPFNVPLRDHGAVLALYHDSALGRVRNMAELWPKLDWT